MYRRLWCAGVLLVAVPALLLALTSLGSGGGVTLLVLSSLAAAGLTVADREKRPECRSWRRSARVFAAVVTLAFVVAGVVTAAGAAGVVLLAVLALIAPRSIRAAVLRPTARPEPPPPVPEPAWRTGVVHVRKLSDEQLRLVWLHSNSRVGRGGTVDERLEVVRLRATILDELERRDPDNFALSQFHPR